VLEVAEEDHKHVSLLLKVELKHDIQVLRLHLEAQTIVQLCKRSLIVFRKFSSMEGLAGVENTLIYFLDDITFIIEVVV